MEEFLLAAELDVLLATGWTEEYLDGMIAQKVVSLHMRWQYNQMRFNGMMGGGLGMGGGASSQPSAKSDKWKSQTIKNADGSQTMRTNISDMFDSNVASRINNAGGKK